MLVEWVWSSSISFVKKRFRCAVSAPSTAKQKDTLTFARLALDVVLHNALGTVDQSLDGT